MHADLPNHPTRSCEVTHYADMPCPICGWPTTHTEPAAIITGLFGDTGIRIVTDDRMPPDSFRLGPPRKIAHIIPVHKHVLMDAGVIPDTRPTPPAPGRLREARWQLQYHADNLRQRSHRCPLVQDGDACWWRVVCRRRLTED